MFPRRALSKYHPSDLDRCALVHLAAACCKGEYGAWLGRGLDGVRVLEILLVSDLRSNGTVKRRAKRPLVCRARGGRWRGG